MTADHLKSMLGDQEEILHISRRHGLFLLGNVLAEIVIISAIAIAVTAAMRFFQLADQAAYGYLLIVLPLASLIYKTLKWVNHKYVITDCRVIEVFGVLNKTTFDFSLSKVNEVKTRQSAVGRLFGYGDIQILTASDFGLDYLERIRNPVDFKATIVNARNELVYNQEEISDSAIPAIIGNLDDLRKKGILTDEEFERKKEKLLKRM